MSEYGRLQINLLGKPEVWLDGEMLTHFSTAKTEALLYYLAATGQTHSRESLAGLLWAEMPEARARRNLTKSLTVLRRLLEPFLLIEAQRVGFDPDVTFELDVTLLETAASTSPGAVASSPQALAFYRGDFLEGFFVKDALAFEEWQLTRREQLRAIAIGALETLLEQATNQREYAAGIEYGRRLLELDPWRESAHRQLMLLLARHGRRAAALEQYEQCHQVLADELGVEPMPETTALYERLRLAHARRPPPLPMPGSALVGRQEEINQLNSLLSHPDCRLITIIGLGGIGKTHLALAMAHLVNQEHALLFINGIIYIPLAGVANPDQLPVILAESLGIRLGGQSNAAAQVQSYLRQQELLLVLDNFEHLLAGVGLIQNILQHCPYVKMLVTSREPLQLAAEWRFDLKGLAYPVNGTAATDVATYSAGQLFQQAAAQVKPAFTYNADNTLAVQRICQLVGGIPLGIRLAAAWLRVLSPEQIAHEIETNMDILATTMRDVSPRQRSMRAIFDYTWSLLTTEEQRVFAHLAVFQDGFTMEAAQAVAGANVAQLAQLVDHSLLHLGENGRYSWHELTRQYAAAKLSELGQGEAAKALHGRYFARWLEAFESQLHGPEQQAVFATVRQDLSNVRTGWLEAVEQGWAVEAGAYLETLYTLYLRLHRLSEGIDLLERAAARWLHQPNLTEAEMTLLARLLSRLGAYYDFWGQPTQARERTLNSLEYANRIEAVEPTAYGLTRLAAIANREREFDEGRRRSEEALALYERIDDWKGRSQALAVLGTHYVLVQNYAMAELYLEQALALNREHGDMVGACSILSNLGELKLITGNYYTAKTYLEEAAAILREQDVQFHLIDVLNNLGWALESMGENDEALRVYQESLSLCLSTGDVFREALTLERMGNTSRKLGKYAAARGYLDRALRLNRADQRDYSIVYNLYFLALVDEAEGQLAAARRRHQEAVSLYQKVQDERGEALANDGLGRVAILEGTAAAARPYLQRALQLTWGIRNESLTLNMLLTWGQYFVALGELEEAASLFAFIMNHPLAIDDIRSKAATSWAQLPDPLQEKSQSKCSQIELSQLILNLSSELPRG